MSGSVLRTGHVGGTGHADPAFTGQNINKIFVFYIGQRREREREGGEKRVEKEKGETGKRAELRKRERVRIREEIKMERGRKKSKESGKRG